MGWSFKVCMLLGAAFFATGCASTAKGITQSQLSKVAPSQTLKKEVPTGTVLAVVRYPAFVDDTASEAYYKAFGNTAIGGGLKSYNPDSPEVQALADSIILKSNYFALSLFKELAAKLPAHSVLLSPHNVKLGADGKLTSEPMTQAESLPNVVTVDFSAYTFPDPTKMMGAHPLTFGDLITPLVTVHTDHRASVPTQGLRLASAPLVQRAARNGMDKVNDSLRDLQNGQLKPVTRELDFVAYLKEAVPLNVETQSLSPLGKPNSVQSYPVEKISLDKQAIKWLEDDVQGSSTDPLKDTFSKPFANQIVGVINQTDIDKATLAGRAAAISQFDESLAALTLVGSDQADYQSRLKYAERLLEAEQKYLSVQSLRLFDGVQNGEIGAQVRDLILAETDVLDKRRELARKQNVSTALAVIGAVAAGATIAGGGGPSTYGEQIAIDALIQGVLVAGQYAYSTAQTSKAVSNNFLSSIVPALEEQTSIQVSLIDSNETITAIRYEDLAAKLQTLYNDSQRSLETIATRCGYTDTSLSKTGTWLGVCENGLANGAGVGVIRNDDGTAVEYYGYAQNGQPNGAGYMINHSHSGSTSMEGNFVAGKPQGVMKVSKSGQPNQLRQFSSGLDTGAAPAGARAISPFNTSLSANQLWTN